MCNLKWKALKRTSRYSPISNIDESKLYYVERDNDSNAFSRRCFDCSNVRFVYETRTTLTYFICIIDKDFEMYEWYMDVFFFTIDASKSFCATPKLITKEYFF